MNIEQIKKIKENEGFIAALDQSGGSTPKALQTYGIQEDAYSDENEMFDLIHEMRTRIIVSPSFEGGRILGAILFENTMDREISGESTAEYLWNSKRVVPFLKVDKGLADEEDGVQVMKPMPDLDALLEKANSAEIFGTKMRSVIKFASPSGIDRVVDQQFAIGKQILAAGLVPISEPEVDINSAEKRESEELLRSAIERNLDDIKDPHTVMLKLTLPEEDNFYECFVNDDRVLRVVALSGGYSRLEANSRMSRNSGLVASFSRALTEGLSANQSQEEFDSHLNGSIQEIFEASNT